jgi:FixJ family two-component response regulator
MKPNNRTIFIIDDDPTVLSALRYLFESVHLQVETYQSARVFLDKYSRNKHGCILIDVRMPIMSGLELLEQLNEQKNRLPVIMMTGHGDIPMAIRAMKLGAVDFIEKPFNDQCLLDVIQKHIDSARNRYHHEDIRERVDRLSQRERQVLDLITDGKLTKEIAYELSVSISTIEAHRANIMRKMQAKNLAQLINFYLKFQFDLQIS